MSDDHGSGASVILAFLLGGLTGAALAILYAPRTGSETREIIGERFREGAERGRELRERVVGRGREAIEDASDYVEKKRETMTKKKDRIAAAVEAGKQAYREEKEKA
jgi:gas vesicle protein